MERAQAARKGDQRLRRVSALKPNCISVRNILLFGSASGSTQLFFRCNAIDSTFNPETGASCIHIISP